MSGKSTLWLHRSFQFSATAATEMCRGSCDEVCTLAVLGAQLTSVFSRIAASLAGPSGLPGLTP